MYQQYTVYTSSGDLIHWTCKYFLLVSCSSTVRALSSHVTTRYEMNWVTLLPRPFLRLWFTMSQQSTTVAPQSGKWTKKTRSTRLNVSFAIVSWKTMETSLSGAFGHTVQTASSTSVLWTSMLSQTVQKPQTRCWKKPTNERRRGNTLRRTLRHASGSTDTSPRSWFLWMVYSAKRWKLSLRNYPPCLPRSGRKPTARSVATSMLKWALLLSEPPTQARWAKGG
jgi:hypothetical protein